MWESNDTTGNNPDPDPNATYVRQQNEPRPPRFNRHERRKMASIARRDK